MHFHWTNLETTLPADAEYSEWNDWAFGAACAGQRPSSAGFSIECSARPGRRTMRRTCTASGTSSSPLPPTPSAFSLPTSRRPTNTMSFCLSCGNYTLFWPLPKLSLLTSTTHSLFCFPAGTGQMTASRRTAYRTLSWRMPSEWMAEEKGTTTTH